MRPSSLLAVAVSAVLGVALGVAGGLALDHRPATFDDPLSLDAPLVNQTCTGAFLLAIGKGDGGSALGFGLASNHGGRYLDTRKSCDTVWTNPDRPTPRWVAYLGPYASGARACAVRMTAEHKSTTVTQLSSDATATVHCLCYLDYKAMPTLQTGMTADITDVMWTRTLQNTLVDMGRARKADASGVYDLTTAAHIRQFQRDSHLEATGVVDADTWQSLQILGCRLYDLPSTKASP